MGSMKVEVVEQEKRGNQMENAQSVEVQEPQDRLHLWNGLAGPAEAARWVESHLQATRAAVAELLSVEGERTAANTLALYERWFGPPLIAFWPGTHARFATRPRWRMVDSHTAFVLPRLGLRWLRGAGLAGLAMLAPTPAAADLLEPVRPAG